jgi:hypothetical protein
VNLLEQVKNISTEEDWEVSESKTSWGVSKHIEDGECDEDYPIN